MQGLTERELRSYYIDWSSKFAELGREALFTVQRALEASDIKVASSSQRLKSEDSFIRKGLEKHVSDGRDITDLAAIRIVCLFISDLERIGTILDREFDISSIDDKIEGNSASQFGYMSVHYVGRMKATYKGPRYARIRDLPLEIQVRTLLMDAWANVSHFLSYKSEADIPTDLKRVWGSKITSSFAPQLVARGERPMTSAG
jgi:putative GTP pyrophosphokinase